MKQLQEALAHGRLLLDLEASDIESACRTAVRRMVSEGWLPGRAADEVIEGLLARERDAPAAIGHAAAIPHVYLDVLTEPLVVFVRLTRPI